MEVAWIEIDGAASGRRVRVFIESPGESTQPAGLADCERMNERLSVLLDVGNPFPGPYTLEVSTAGIDRPLRSLADCRKFSGRRVRVRFREERGPRTVTGVLTGVGKAGIDMEGTAGAMTVRWSDVEAARLAPDFAALLGAAKHRRSRRA